VESGRESLDVLLVVAEGMRDPERRRLFRCGEDSADPDGLDGRDVWS
jgi:hypothetical protein